MAKDKGSFSTAGTATPKVMQRLNAEAAAWVSQHRKISRVTLERLRVGCGTAWFGEFKREMPAIFFPYEDEAWKARAMPEKAFTSKAGMEVTFWGLREVLAGKMDRVYIVEGEFDRCALVEAGIQPDQVLAVPGASGGKNAELQYVKEAIAAGLYQAKKFVLMTDQDKPGLELRAALAQVLGIAKCWFIEWPEGVNDANDFLHSDGPGALRDLAERGPVEWPTYGVYKMSQIPEQAPLRRWRPGFEEWGDRLFMASNTLSVATGHPGHGKTQLWAQIWFNVIRDYDLVACIATFETRARPHYQRMLRQFYCGCALKYADLEKIKAADRWIEEHYRFLDHPEQKPTLEWLLSQAETVVYRNGAKVLQIDPFNRLEAQREAKESETDYIGRCLRACYQFATDMQAHVQILAHPSKSNEFSRGKMPTLEDIHGSKHWDNMPDQGFSVWRPRLFDDTGNRQTYAELHHLKARFDDLGYPSKFGIDFDLDRGRFGTCQLQQPKKKQPAAPAD